jgi:uncharacterized protein YlxW (UPF0749 family)
MSLNSVSGPFVSTNEQPHLSMATVMLATFIANLWMVKHRQKKKKNTHRRKKTSTEEEKNTPTQTTIFQLNSEKMAKHAKLNSVCISRVARGFIFKPKIPIWVNLGGP